MIFQIFPGNHFHFSAGKGKFNGNGWTPNTNGKYVLTTTAGQFKPEQLFYIDETFTKIINSKGLIFKTLSTFYKNYIFSNF